MKDFRCCCHVFCLLVLLFLSSFAAAQNAADDSHVIAIVVGQKITSNEIKPTELEIEHRIKFDRDWNHEVDNKVFVTKQLELEKLHTIVRFVFLPFLRQKLGLSVSDMIAKEQALAFKYNFSFEDMANEMTNDRNMKYDPIINALNMVYKDHGDPQIAYDKFLKGNMPEILWHTYIQCYKDKVIREKFEEDCRSVIYGKEYAQASFQMCMDRIMGDSELQNAILEDVLKMNPATKQDIKNYRKGDYHSLSNGNIRLQEPINKWWKVQNKKYIVVKDRQYDSLLDFAACDVLFTPIP